MTCAFKAALIGASLALMCSACSRTEQNAESTEPASAPANEHVWSDQTRALDKARAVEGMLDEAVRRRDAEGERQAQ